MTVRCQRSAPRHAAVAGQELVDAIAAAVDVNRYEEVRQVTDALEFFGLDEDLADELRLSGVPSVCTGECWTEVPS